MTRPPEDPPKPGAGTVHHVAFASRMDEHESWRERVANSGAHPTPVIDRFYFRSIYFREPSGVLFEIATIGPGFAVDEDAEHLGEHLSLPPRFEPLRERLEQELTPLPYPRVAPAWPEPAKRRRRSARAGARARIGLPNRRPRSLRGPVAVHESAQSLVESPSGSSRWERVGRVGSVRKWLCGTASCASRPWLSGIVLSRSPQTISVGIDSRR